MSHSASDYQQLLQQVQFDLTQRAIELPTLPKVANKIIALTSDNDSGVDDIAQAIQLDPAIAGKVVSISNSALYRSQKAHTSVQQAIFRLGLATTRSLVIGVAMAHIFHGGNSQLTVQMHTFWESSVKVAAISQAISEISGNINPDEAMLAGLIHRIGDIGVLYHLSKRKTLCSPGQLAKLIDELRTDVAITIINDWGFGQKMIDVVRNWGKWYQLTQELDLVDIVNIAMIVEKPDSDTSLPNVQSIPAFAKLELDIDAAEAKSYIRDLANSHLESAKELLVS